MTAIRGPGVESGKASPHLVHIRGRVLPAATK